MKDKIELIKEKVQQLNKAAEAYYQHDKEIMSNFEYDKLYDELVNLEEETGVVLSNSPTVNVGYELLSDLPKEAHDKKMLSLDKTKDVNALKSWLGKMLGMLSWKLDGLTIVLTYEDGKLVKAVTRGNGAVGEVITNNAKVFINLPLTLAHKGTLIIRGEAIIKYSDFEKINQELGEAEAKYKNPRNLCSGSVRQLNNKITAKRNVNFYGFSVVRADGIEDFSKRSEQLLWLKEQGFDTVEYTMVSSDDIESKIKEYEEKIETSDLPSDGLVLAYDDIKYGQSLGTTAKFPRDSIAFKWKDEIRETILKEIEWSASRTGLINPIAIFEPVELEGTTVSRASVHNLSILEGLKLGIGDTILVYKANMIIPQISENLTMSGNVVFPNNCPVCGTKTEIKEDSDVKVLFCPNEECLAKHIKSVTHFVSRDAMGIDGLSEATIEKLIGKGLIKEFADIFKIEKYKNEIVEMEGFGEKSYNNLIEAINKARKTNVIRLLYSLGIPNFGLSNANNICKHFEYEWDKIEAANEEELLKINGVGSVMAISYVNYFSKPQNQKIIKDIIEEIEFEKIEKLSGNLIFEDVVFAITGSVLNYKNRNELKKIIENNGGKVTDSISAKTNYLINNDNLSNSTKNKKAKELGIPVITENDFDKMLI